MKKEEPTLTHLKVSGISISKQERGKNEFQMGEQPKEEEITIAYSGRKTNIGQDI